MDLNHPRKDYISWEEYFMGIALLAAQRSKDPSSQVGACIVDDNNKIVSIGYNGMPRGLDESKLSWAREGTEDTKYLYVCHAEFNAILNTRNGADLKGCTIYVTLFPCNECTKAIIQTGIKEVVYIQDKYADLTWEKASKKMLELAGVKLRRYEGKKLILTRE